MLNGIFFTIITTTHKRPFELKRAIKSIVIQNYNNWEMIIVNDSPDFDYKEIEEFFKNKIDQNIKSKIKYFINTDNMGKNYSCNLILKKIAEDKSVLENNHYIIFLDDDDWLNTNALKDINSFLKNKNNIDWLITNRIIIKQSEFDFLQDKVYKNKIDFFSFTRIKKIKSKYNYFFDYLLFKNISGDATHIIKKDIATKINFSNKIKNGEEWLYFLQINKPIFYSDLNTTATEGYLKGGLTDKLKTAYNQNTKVILKEVFTNYRLFLNIKVIIYIILRTCKTLFDILTNKVFK